MERSYSILATDNERLIKENRALAAELAEVRATSLRVEAIQDARVREAYGAEHAAQACIRELEAALRLIADAKDVRGCDEIARQALGLTAETDCDANS